MGGLRDLLPDGLDDEAAWRRGHRGSLAALVAGGPVLLVVGLLAGAPGAVTAVAVAVPLAAGVGGRLAPGRWARCALVTLGLLSSCVALVVLSGGADAASLSFFVVIGFLALYQHWAPLAAVVATAATVGLLASGPAALLHAGAVLLAAGGVLVLLGVIRGERIRRGHEDATSRLLLDLARRNHDLAARQIAVLHDLEAVERDPDVLSELVRLDVLAARMHRDAESLLVLSGRRPDRSEHGPATLADVVRAGVAETDAEDRVRVTVDERIRVLGRPAADLAHIVAELVENAARCSAPGAAVHIAARAHGWRPGAHQLVVEDTGPGLAEPDLEAANRLLAGKDGVGRPGGVGLAVVSRLAAGHRIEVALRSGSAGGLVAVVVLPEAVLATSGPDPAPTEPSSVAPSVPPAPVLPAPVLTVPPPPASAPPTVALTVPPPPASASPTPAPPTPAPPTPAPPTPGAPTPALTVPTPLPAPGAPPPTRHAAPVARWSPDPPEPTAPFPRPVDVPSVEPVEDAEPVTVEPPSRLVHPVVVPVPRPADPGLVPSPRSSAEDAAVEHEPNPPVPSQRRHPTRLVRPWTVPPPPLATSSEPHRPDDR